MDTPGLFWTFCQDVEFMLCIQYKTRPCVLAQDALSLFLAVSASSMLVGLFVQLPLPCLLKG